MQLSIIGICLLIFQRNLLLGRIDLKILVTGRKKCTDYTEEQKVISLSEKSVFNLIKNHGLSLGHRLNPHSLRKWCASYWKRKEETGMVNFVLRHNLTKLKDRYVASLSIEEILGKQEIMEEELFVRK